ncbi:DNA topoisomerase [Xenorhabdus bovienii]|uniref:DNA topoisomerase n=2 Tax=Xenorhabdus bovienii TaxID=40576 RepID=UPI001F5BD2CE|nr:DNA topoisomerase [Xenorhabdus bovienii]
MQAAQSVLWQTVVFWAALFYHLPLLRQLEGELEDGHYWQPGVCIPDKPFRFRFRAPENVLPVPQELLLAARLLPEEFIRWVMTVPEAWRCLMLHMNGNPSSLSLIDALLQEAAEWVHSPLVKPVISPPPVTETDFDSEIDVVPETTSIPPANEMKSLSQSASDDTQTLLSLFQFNNEALPSIGMGASQVLTIAQSLYETHKATTYPRTDCGYLPVSMQTDIPVMLTALVRTDPAMAGIISQLDEQLVSRVWNDKKITAHHAIIPTRHAFDLTRLTTDELQIYQLIRQHYLAQFLPMQETDVTEVTLDIGGQCFRAKGRVNVTTGWKALFTENQEKSDVDSPLPRFQQGDCCQIIEASIQSLHTKPPTPFTEGTLIAAMKNAASLVSDPQLKQVLRESAGLGTEATRAGILDTLFKRRLIERKKKAIQSTPLARELVAGLPEVLTSPGMTALWEQSLDDIAQGKTSLAVFMQKQVQWLLHLVELGKAQPFHLTLPKTPDCPNCGSRMRQRQGKTSPFWGCVNYPGCKGVLNDKAVTQSRKARRANQRT